MPSDPDLGLTGLLRAWSSGDANALELIVVQVYPELHAIARRFLSRERPGHTLQATALVHEAYLRLVDLNRIDWRDRVHFFAVGARVMRRILVDYARSKHNAKRGGGVRHLNLNEALLVSDQSDPALARMDEALNELATFDPRKAQIVEMRYFGGLNANDIASVLGVSPQTVNRDWSLAKAWLARAMISHEQNVGLANRAGRS